MNREYIPFTLTIEQESDSRYQVTAEFIGRRRQAEIPAGLPLLKPSEIAQAHTWLSQGYFNLSFAKDFGGRLFQTFFTGAVLDLFHAALDEAPRGGGLRLLLDLPLPAALEGLPWELLYAEKEGLGFLARSTRAPLARHYTDLERMHAIPETAPLRVLIAAASPPAVPPISTDQEIAAIEKALEATSLTWGETLQTVLGHIQERRSFKGLKRRLAQRRVVECQLLAHASYSNLQAKILEAKNNETPFHVIHFIGHGQGGVASSLIFESEDEAFKETGEPVPAETFAELVGEESVCLVVLNACETAGQGLIENTARQIQRKGVPAVIGMQVAVLDRSAVAFAGQFYGAWALGEPLESALAYGRRQIPDERRGSAADWAIPSLYMGPQDGLSLNLAVPKVRTPRPIKFAIAAISAFIFLVSLVTATLAVPGLARQVRSEVPLIRCWFPYPMEDGKHFNVAVAEFNGRDENGRWGRSADGKTLAMDIFTRLEAEKAALGSAGFELRTLPLVCPLPAGEPAEREAAARELAEKLKADILIYGVVEETSEKSAWFTPQFYINTVGFEQGEEVIGPHKLGDPLELPVPINPDEVRAGGYLGLNVRDAALVQIVSGLVSYALDNQDDAILHFTQAKDLKELRDRWGKDFIYLMLGNAYGQKSARLLELPDYQTYVELVNLAIASYSESLRINQDYARAQIGLAETTRRLAQNPFDPSQPYDLAMLTEAEAAFQKALTMADQPESANIPAKVHFGLGMIALMRASQAAAIEASSAQAAADLAAAGLPSPVEEFQAAETEFNEVIRIWQMNDENPGTSDIRLNTQAAHSYISLAWVAMERGESDRAAEAIGQAVEIASPYQRGRYLTFLGQVYAAAGKQEEACGAYQRAANAANLIGDNPTAEAAEGILAELGCK